MPTYDYKCSGSGKVITRFMPISMYQGQVECECGKMAVRHITQAPMGFVRPDLPAYKCPITDKPITSRREHEENLARHGCRVLESGEKEQMMKRRAAEEEALLDKVAETAAEVAAKLPAESREQLGRALESGLDMTVVRQ